MDSVPSELRSSTTTTISSAHRTDSRQAGRRSASSRAIRATETATAASGVAAVVDRRGLRKRPGQSDAQTDGERGGRQQAATRARLSLGQVGRIEHIDRRDIANFGDPCFLELRREECVQLFVFLDVAQEADDLEPRLRKRGELTIDLRHLLPNLRLLVRAFAGIALNDAEPNVE